MALWSGLRSGYRSGRLSRHLSEAELVGLLVPGSDVPTASDAANRVHLSQCRSCAGRSADLQSLLDAVSETARFDAETHMSTERLTSQRERIMRRLRRSVEPAQAAHVIRFPSIAQPTPTYMRRARWLTGAAVAGLVVGIATGQFLHLHPLTESTDTVLGDTVAPQNTTASRRLVGNDVLSTLEDDAFLQEVDLMLLAPRIPELDPLDEITPRIREVAVSPW
jgi:ElaB/YqjD/DUF883 family membrane-anchored ribosome-binding protein